MAERTDLEVPLRLALVMGGQSVEDADDLIASYRAAVVNEAADDLWRRTLLADDCGCDAELRRMAAEDATSPVEPTYSRPEALAGLRAAVGDVTLTPGEEQVLAGWSCADWPRYGAIRGLLRKTREAGESRG